MWAQPTKEAGHNSEGACAACAAWGAHLGEEDRELVWELLGGVAVLTHAALLCVPHIVLARGGPRRVDAPPRAPGEAQSAEAR